MPPAARGVAVAAEHAGEVGRARRSRRCRARGRSGEAARGRPHLQAGLHHAAAGVGDGVADQRVEHLHQPAGVDHRGACRARRRRRPAGSRRRSRPGRASAARCRPSVPAAGAARARSPAARRRPAAARRRRRAATASRGPPRRWSPDAGCAPSGRRRRFRPSAAASAWAIGSRTSAQMRSIRPTSSRGAGQRRAAGGRGR